MYQSVHFSSSDFWYNYQYNCTINFVENYMVVKLKCCMMYSKTCVKQPLSKRPKIGLLDQLSLNAGQKYCRMLQGEGREHSAILLTFIKLPVVIKKSLFCLFLSVRFTQVLLYRNIFYFF